jgi:hypothetical protein
MKTVQAILGYTVAALSIPLMIFAFMGAAGGLDESVAEATGLRVAPEFTGGEVVQTIDHGTYETRVHRQVFDGLLWERRKGFIQVGWAPPDNVPAYIDQEIDADQDGQADFRIELDTDTREATLTPYASYVVELQGVYKFEHETAIRVVLDNPNR